MNSQGSFFDPFSWSCELHNDFVKSVVNGNDLSAGEYCQELIKNMLMFLSEVHTEDEVDDMYQYIPYNSNFITAIFAVTTLELPKEDLKALNAGVDFTCMIECFRKYVHHVIRRARDDKCSCLRHGSECGIAIATVVKLAELLHAEAIALTVKRWPTLREFVVGSLHREICQAVGADILACSRYIHKSVKRLEGAPEEDLTLNSVPCDLLLYHMSIRFGVRFCKVSPRHDFDSVLKIKLAVAEVKKGSEESSGPATRI